MTRSVASRSIRSALVLVLAGFVVLLAAGPARAWNPNYQFCFRDVVNTPDTYLQPPVIDGVISGDRGWTSGWRYVFNNGTFVHDATAQGIKDNNFVYLSFEVNHDPELNADDAVVIALDPTGAAAERRLLQIFPVVPSGAASPVPVSYWQGFPWSGGGTAPPAGTEVAATVSGTTGNRSWFVEVKLPRAAFGIPAAGNFGLYFNVLPNQGGLVMDHPWPADTASVLGDLKNTPDVNTWGQATVAAVTCNGVYIRPSDIRTDNTPPSKINLNAPNTFRATVHNTTIDGTGSYTPVSGINATFRIANFGLPSAWQNVPATAPSTNPTAATNIGANSTADLTTSWTLTAAERTTYAANPHQCILVELDTTAPAPGTTVFSNKSAWTNMNFGTASTFAQQPEIDLRGWPQLKRETRAQQIELLVTKQTDELPREQVLELMRAGDELRLAARAAVAPAPTEVEGWSSLKEIKYFPVERDDNWKEFMSRLERPDARISQLAYLVHGCRRTGDSLMIHENKYEVCQRIGSYGTLVRHAGVLQAQWDVAVDGPGLVKVGEAAERYRITVPVDKPVTLRNTFVAREAPTGEDGGKKPICGLLKMASTGVLVAGLLMGGLLAYRLRRPDRES